MKKLLSLAITSALLSSAMVSTASAEVSGNLGATSNYLWRGMTQASNSSAFSGGIDYASDIGLYVGTWGSNAWGGGEYDLYAGYGFEAGDFSFDVGYVSYMYSDVEDGNFAEAYLGLGYSFFSVKASTLTNADWEADAGDDTYIEAAADFEVAEALSLGLHVGTYMHEAEGTDDSIDYNVSLTKTFELGDANFMISNTDIDGEDDPRFVVSWSTEFTL